MLLLEITKMSLTLSYANGFDRLKVKYTNEKANGGVRGRIGLDEMEVRVHIMKTQFTFLDQHMLNL